MVSRKRMSRGSLVASSGTEPQALGSRPEIIAPNSSAGRLDRRALSSATDQLTSTPKQWRRPAMVPPSAVTPGTGEVGRDTVAGPCNQAGQQPQSRPPQPSWPPTNFSSAWDFSGSPLWLLTVTSLASRHSSLGETYSNTRNLFRKA
jgi:hypothetical protein